MILKATVLYPLEIYRIIKAFILTYIKIMLKKATLKKNESGELTLSIKFDGETEVNDYMDTYGGVMMRLAVNVHNPQSETTEKDEPEYKQKVKTGDVTNILPYIVMLLIGLILLIIVWRKMRSEQGGEAR